MKRNEIARDFAWWIPTTTIVVEELDFREFLLIPKTPWLPASPEPAVVMPAEATLPRLKNTLRAGYVFERIAHGAIS